jgi:hypothetical protein
MSIILVLMAATIKIVGGVKERTFRVKSEAHLNLISAALVLRLVTLWFALKYQWGFFAVMAIALFFALAPDVLAALLAGG